MTTVNLTDKVALVTGGARRVGRTVALQLAEAGMHIALTYRQSSEEARQVVKLIEKSGRQGVAIQADLSKPDAAEYIHEVFSSHFDSLWTLINNASLFESSPIGEVKVASYDRQMAVNARAPLMLSQKFAPLLAAHKQPGRIINFIDIHVMGQPLCQYIAYNASKAALQEITVTCAMELAPKVTVNAIAPGVVAWADSYTEEQKHQYMKRVPLARPGTPEDAAAAVLYLIRDADYCTGQIIKIDGGRLLT